jgi:agmatinase
MKSAGGETSLPKKKWTADNLRIKELGLEPAESIEDKTEFSCFQRGSLPHWSGINTLLRAPYLEDVHKVGEYDVAFVGRSVRHCGDLSHGNTVRASGDAPNLCALPKV